VDYASFLYDKRWVKKRNKIFKRDNFKCTVCGSKKNIQVHHTYYYKGMFVPWIYPNDSLLTLCRNCHLKWHRENENIYIDKPIKHKGWVERPAKVKPKKKKYKKRKSIAERQSTEPRYKPRKTIS